MAAYYNEHEPFAAEWLRGLIAAGRIAGGDVDGRSIADVSADDLGGYRQHHFFAGIGGWAYALALAGWPADRPVWTGSCPCQPFSSAGRQGGALDERHLWPWWLRLIRECRPDAILGEQVEGAVGFGWVDRVFADLEAEGYATGAAVLGAHSVGAPHIRQRLFWVSQSNGAGVWDHARPLGDEGRRAVDAGPASLRPGNGADVRDGAGAAGGAGGVGLAAREQVGRARQPWQDSVWPSDRRLADADGGNASAEWLQRGREQRQQPQDGGVGFWDDAVWLPCLDGKARRVVASLQPLAHAGECICGLRLGELCACGERPSRVGMLRGSGNAIIPVVAAEFIKAFMDCVP